MWTRDQKIAFFSAVAAVIAIIASIYQKEIRIALGADQRISPTTASSPPPLVKESTPTTVISTPPPIRSFPSPAIEKSPQSQPTMETKTRPAETTDLTGRPVSFSIKDDPSPTDGTIRKIILPKGDWFYGYEGSRAGGSSPRLVCVSTDPNYFPYVDGSFSIKYGENVVHSRQGKDSVGRPNHTACFYFSTLNESEAVARCRTGWPYSYSEKMLNFYLKLDDSENLNAVYLVKSYKFVDLLSPEDQQKVISNCKQF